MLQVTFTLAGVSDLMFSKYVAEKKRDDETHDQHERRTWPQKVAVTDDGQCFLQPFALKNCLESAAKWLSLKIPGERNKTFTKRFLSGILVSEKLLLTNAKGKPLTMGDVSTRLMERVSTGIVDHGDIDPMELFVPSDGVRGSGKRVIKVFPTLHEWQAAAEIVVFDNKITEEVMHRHLEAAGKFIGLGAMRAGNGGINGRFSVEDLKAEKVES